jgi:hypothetical protein
MIQNNGKLQKLCHLMKIFSVTSPSKNFPISNRVQFSYSWVKGQKVKKSVDF